MRRNCTEYARSWQRTATDPQIGPTLLLLAQTKSNDRATRQGLMENLKEVVIDHGWGEGW